MLILNYLLAAIIGGLLMVKQTKWLYLLFFINTLGTFLWFMHHTTNALGLNL